MEKLSFEKFSKNMINRDQTSNIKGGIMVECSCSYFGGAFTESGACAGGSAQTCANEGANKYGANSGQCICM